MNNYQDEKGEDKINVDYFYGDRTKLKYFITQLITLFSLQPRKYPDPRSQVLYAAMRMKGNAFSWFEPTLTNYLREPESRTEETKTIFEKFLNFEAAITLVFGVANEDRAAERLIYQLKQQGSAAQYFAQFKQVAAKLKWEPNALKAAYYAGLKDEVKDRMIEEVPKDYQDMVEKSIEIDNRLYERRMEKGGRPRNSQRWTGYNGTTSRMNYGDPMDLSVMQEKRPSRPKTRGRGGHQGNSAEREKRKANNLCYNCGKPGHRARDCKGSAPTLQMMNIKKKRTSAGIVGKKADTTMSMNDTSSDAKAQKELHPERVVQKESQKEIPHEHMSWTVCYEDSCLTHRSEKDGSGWFPQPPGNQNSDSDQESEWSMDEGSDPYLIALREGVAEKEVKEGNQPPTSEVDDSSEFSEVEDEEGISRELKELRQERKDAEKILRGVLARLREIRDNLPKGASNYALNMMNVQKESDVTRGRKTKEEEDRENLARLAGIFILVGVLKERFGRTPGKRYQRAVTLGEQQKEANVASYKIFRELDQMERDTSKWSENEPQETSPKYFLSMMNTKIKTDKSKQEIFPLGREDEHKFVVIGTTKEAITMVTNHWRYELCSGAECDQDRQHTNIIFDGNAAKEYVRTMHFKYCNDKECKAAPRLHAHQENWEVLELEIPEQVALKVWGIPKPTMEHVVSKNE